MFTYFRTTAKALLYPFKRRLNFPIRFAFSSATQSPNNPATFNQSNILKHRVDGYRSAHLDSDSVPNDSIQFENMLVDSMKHFRESKYRGVWLRLDLSKSILIPVALKHGYKNRFTYHHAKNDYVLFSQWLPKDEPSKLPNYASHYVGVGGIVINDETDEILVIKEKISFVGNLWKIPGGLVDEGEFISQAAEREVFEETGIKAQFQSVLSFREKLDYKWGKADIYFAVLLKPLTYEIKIDPGEIGEARWMKIDEYLKVNDMIETQMKIAKVVRFAHSKGSEKIKNLDSETLLSFAGYSGERFKMTIGKFPYKEVGNFA